MSNARFTPVTADLFARNGYDIAPPSLISSNPAPTARRNGGACEPRPAAAKAQGSTRPARALHRPHKVRIALSDAEYEAFGIAAVKRGATRNEILREALNIHLSRLAHEYAENCRCLALGPANGTCGCDRALDPHSC
jgi:hypothetical protein